MSNSSVVTIRATFELEPAGSAAALAEKLASGLATVVSEESGRVVVELPDGLWRGDVVLLVSALVTGKPTGMAACTRCRLVDLELPEGALLDRRSLPSRMWRWASLAARTAQASPA